MNQKLANTIIEQFGVDESQVTEQTKFVEDLGCDSLDYAEILIACEEVFGIEISDAAAEKVVTVADAQRLIESLLSRTN